MCYYRESNHWYRNDNAGWDGVVFDVFDEAVFDAGGVFLEGEDEAWKANAAEAD